MTNGQFESFLTCARRLAIAVEGDTDDGTLQDIASIIGDARIVGMGESQHYVGEFSRFRSRLFRHLVRHHGFTTFVFEAGVVEAKSTYDYVLGRHHDRERAHLGIDSTFGLWGGTQSVVDWMREHNEHCSKGDELRFYGMDGSQGWSGTHAAVSCVHEYLRKTDPDFADEISDTLLPLAQSVTLDEVGEVKTEEIFELARCLNRLETRMRIEAAHYIERSCFEAFDWAQRAAIIAREISSMLCAVHEKPGESFRLWWNMRDACMAEQLLWILRREGPSARLLVGAHNIHIQKVFARETGFPLSTMGQHLSARLGENQFVVIAGTSDESLIPGDRAREDSFQSALAQVGSRSFLLDLRAVDEPAARSWLDREKPDRSAIYYQPLHTGGAWDVVFYTPTIALDDLRLPKSLDRTTCDPDPVVAAGLTGTFVFDGVVDTPVELTIRNEDGILVTEGLKSDGELFPIHQSRLFAMAPNAFFWTEWSMELVCDSDEDGTISKIGIRYPGEQVKFHGRRKK